jgi:hypothetical protein
MLVALGDAILLLVSAAHTQVMWRQPDQLSTLG